MFSVSYSRAPSVVLNHPHNAAKLTEADLTRTLLDLELTPRAKLIASTRFGSVEDVFNDVRKLLVLSYLFELSHVALIFLTFVFLYTNIENTLRHM